jgi:hypothetical protein
MITTGTLLAYHALIFLAAVAIGLSFVIRAAAEKKGGPAVGTRFLESPDGLRALVDGTLPIGPAAAAGKTEIAPELVAEKLHDWIRANETHAKAYARPILIPYDIVFLIALGLFLVIAPPLIAWPAVTGWMGLPAGAVVLAIFALPGVVYLIVDVIEDVTLARYLTGKKPIAADSVRATMRLTAIKITSVQAGLALTAALALIGIGVDACAILNR